MRGLLTAFYDFEVSPTGFDFVTFLALAEIARRNGSYDALRVVFVLGENRQFWTREPYSTKDQEWRLQNLLIPLTGLYSSCQSLVVCQSRKDAEDLVAAAGDARFPSRYTPSQPVEDAYQWANLAAAVACGAEIVPWQAPEQPNQMVRKWLATRGKGRKVITITLREASYFPTQNSDIAAWAEFATSLDTSRYFPVLLRDAEFAYDPLPSEFRGLTDFPLASVAVQFRAALYQLSYLNLMSAGGPMQLAWTNPECRSLVFKVLNLENFRSTPVPLRSMGLEPGRQPITASKFQDIVWGPDDIDTIRAAFVEMVDRIDHDRLRVSSSREPALRLARRLRNTARYEAARRIYNHVASTEPACAVAARAGLALLDFRQLGRPMKARRIAGGRTDAPSTLCPPDVGEDALIECAQFWHVLRDQERARRYYIAALRIAPENADALNGLGRLALENGNLGEGERLLRAAVRADPYGAQVHYDLGEALLVLGRDDEACLEFETAAKHDPSHQAARHRLEELLDGVPATSRQGSAVGETDIVVPVQLGHGGHNLYYCNGLFYAVPTEAGVVTVDRARRRVVRRGALPLYRDVAARQFSRLGTALAFIDKRQINAYENTMADATAIAQGARPPSGNRELDIAEDLYELMICRSLVDRLNHQLGLERTNHDVLSGVAAGLNLRDIEALNRSLHVRVSGRGKRGKHLAGRIDSYFEPKHDKSDDGRLQLRSLLTGLDSSAAVADGNDETVGSSLGKSIKAALASTSDLQQFEIVLGALMLRHGDHRTASRYFIRAGEMPAIPLAAVKKMPNWLFLLVEGHHGHNILCFDGRFVAVPQKLGRIDADYAAHRLVRVNSRFGPWIDKILDPLPQRVSSAVSRITHVRIPVDMVLNADSIDELIDRMEEAAIERG